MNSNIIIHKIALYLKNPVLTKLFFNLKDYRLLINSSNSHFDELYYLYGSDEFTTINNLKSIESVFRLMPKFVLAGNIDEIIEAINNDDDDDDNAVYIIQKYIDIYAAIGNLEIIKWLHYNWNLDKYIKNLNDYAIEKKMFFFSDWMIKNNNKLTDADKSIASPYAMDDAAKNGHLEVIIWLHENRTEGCTSNAMVYAAGNGHFEIVKWLFQNRLNECMESYGAIAYATQNGHFEIVKWLLTSFRTILTKSEIDKHTKNVIDRAALNNHLEIIKWLWNDLIQSPTTHENLTQTASNLCTHWAAINAAENGHLEIIKWVYQNCQDILIYSIHAMQYAAKNGHLEVVKFLYQNNYDYCNTRTLYYAIEGNQLEIVKWFFQNTNNIKNRCDNIFKDGCLCNHISNNFNILTTAAKYGHLEIVKWLYNNYISEYGKSWNRYLEYFLGHNVVRSFHGERSFRYIDDHIINTTIKITSDYTNQEIKKWLQEQQDSHTLYIFFDP